jgi:hypothetical protein
MLVVATHINKLGCGFAALCSSRLCGSLVCARIEQTRLTSRQRFFRINQAVRELVKVHTHAGAVGPASPLTPYHCLPTLSLGDGDEVWKQVGNGVYRD